MSVILNALLMAIAIFFFAGRMYELTYLLDEKTGFLIYKGVVTHPFILIVLVVIVICCGFLLFSERKLRITAGYRDAKLALILAGLALLGGAVYAAVATTGAYPDNTAALYNVFLLLGGIGLILGGIFGFEGSKKEIPAVLLIALLGIGGCLNTIIFNIATIADTHFLMRSVSAVANLLFFTVLFKMIYAQTKATGVWLYIMGVLNFIFTGVGYAARLVSLFMAGKVTLFEILICTGFICVGFYSIMISFLTLDEKQELDTLEDLEEIEDSFYEEEDNAKSYFQSKKIFYEPAPLPHHQENTMQLEEQENFSSMEDMKQFFNREPQETQETLPRSKRKREFIKQETNATKKIVYKRPSDK